MKLEYGKEVRLSLSSVAHVEAHADNYVRLTIGPYAAGEIPMVALSDVAEAVHKLEDLLPNGWSPLVLTGIEFSPEGDSVYVYVEGYMR